MEACVGHGSGAVVEDQGSKDNQVGSILISLAPPNRPPGSKATDPGRSSTTADGTTMARSPAATAGATILGGNALPETAPAVPAIDQVTGPLCAGALHLSSDEALTEGPGSDMGPGLGNIALLTLTFTPVCAVPLTMSILMVLCPMMMLFLTRPTLILMI